MSAFHSKNTLPLGKKYGIIPPLGYALHLYAGQWWALDPIQAPLILSKCGKKWLNIGYPSPEASVIMPYIQACLMNPHREAIDAAQDKLPGGTADVHA